MHNHLIAAAASALLLVGCDVASIEVTVSGADEVAAVEVVDARVWRGEMENSEGFSVIEEDAALPVTFDVPAGDYVVTAGQGTCSAQEELTVAEGEHAQVALSLSCVE